eukprot:CAMPEP_0174275052 /NCGR_PEP_ID=MMETSP0439-20130205/59615_1 /TAXON_ID=0 /ORGANISM="Stereomyxa ramosa, Strain Chinc5" /LENGTH=303 /DNA_ID=CAMNT_0015367125 /DNA_START=3188 /DNA_END=4100 /DNA_ORIENTATION=+
MSYLVDIAGCVACRSRVRHVDNLRRGALVACRHAGSGSDGRAHVGLDSVHADLRVCFLESRHVPSCTGHAIHLPCVDCIVAVDTVLAGMAGHVGCLVVVLEKAPARQGVVFVEVVVIVVAGHGVAYLVSFVAPVVFGLHLVVILGEEVAEIDLAEEIDFVVVVVAEIVDLEGKGFQVADFVVAAGIADWARTGCWVVGIDCQAVETDCWVVGIDYQVGIDLGVEAVEIGSVVLSAEIGSVAPVETARVETGRVEIDFVVFVAAVVVGVGADKYVVALAAAVSVFAAPNFARNKQGHPTFQHGC